MQELEGVIVKGIGGFYYVETAKGLIECRARGVFRKRKITPLIGDRVTIDENQDGTGYVTEIKDRETEFFRPPVANVSQCVVVFAMKNPDPNLWLVDRFILLAESQNVNIVICITKVDLETAEEVAKLKMIYEKAGFRVILINNKAGEGIEELRKELQDEITVFAGPSGAGKSSLLNNVDPRLKLQTGDVSDKTKRGKHTTRHVELFKLETGGYVLDTPGFSSMDIAYIGEEEVKDYFRDFEQPSQECKYRGCMHIGEPHCKIKEMVEHGEISANRYEHYLDFVKELKDNRRY